MRWPICVCHDRHQYRVVFRRRGGIQNWNVYVQAEDCLEAQREARNILAYDRYHSLKPVVGTTSDTDWLVAEVTLAE